MNRELTKRHVLRWYAKQKRFVTSQQVICNDCGRMACGCTCMANQYLDDICSILNEIGALKEARIACYFE